MPAVGADDEGGGLTRREGLRSHEDSIVGLAVMRKIDDGLGGGRIRRDGDKSHRRAGLAGIGFRAVGIVDHHEIGRLRAFDDLNPNRRRGWVIGETDMKVGMPGRG